MVNFWFIEKEFFKQRKRRIGASDVPALIPSPEDNSVSLAGYDRAPISVFWEKTGQKERDFAGLPAEMGHFLENKVLEVFLREKLNNDIAKKFVNDKILTEIRPELSPAKLQKGPLYHSVQYYTTEGTSGKIAHPDCIFAGDKKNKSFLVEAKSANFWAAKRPVGSKVKGYDLDLKTWQGIPLKHYMQIQYQLALFEESICYLPLIYNTSDYHYWTIEANPKHQGQVIDLVDNMIWHINNNTPPKELIMNQRDVKDIYEKVKDDFLLVSGEKKKQAIKIAKFYNEAHAQEKISKNKKKEALDAMAILLLDYPEIRDENQKIAVWQSKKGSEKMLALSKIKKDYTGLYNYLVKKGLIEETKGSRSVVIKFKEDD